MSDQCDIARSAPRGVAAPAVHGARGDPAAGQGTWCTCSTTTVPGPNGPVMVLRVVGEVDLSTVDLLRTALGSVLAQHAAYLVVDLAGLTFCSARGLTVLSQAGGAAREHGTGYAVAGASARLNWVWALGWTAAERPIAFPTAADAVLAALANQVGQRDRARWEPKHLIRARTGPVVRDAAVALVSVPASLDDPVAGNFLPVLRKWAAVARSSAFE